MPTDASKAFTEAFQESDSAESRQESLEDDDDYNAPDDDDDDSSASGRGPSPDDVTSVEEQTDSESGGPVGNRPSGPSSPVGDTGDTGESAADDTSDGSDSTPEPTQEQAQAFDGSSGSDAIDATDPTKSTDSGLNTDNESTPSGFQGPPEGIAESEGQRDRDEIQSGPPPAEAEQGAESGGQFKAEARQTEFDFIQQAAEQGLNLTRDEVRVDTERTDEGVILRATLNQAGQQERQFEQFQREFETTQDAEEQLQASTAADLVRGDDFTIEQRGNRVSTELTQQGREKETRAQAAQNINARFGLEEQEQIAADDVDVETTTEISSSRLPGDQAVTEVSAQVDPQVLPDDAVKSQPQQTIGSLSGPTRRRFAGANQPEGDGLDRRIGEFIQDVQRSGESGGEPNASGEFFGGRGEIEQRLRANAEGFRGTLIEPTASVAGDVAASNVGVAGQFLPLTPTFGRSLEQTAANVGEGEIEADPALDERERRARAEGFVTGAGEIVNPAGLAVSGIELGEFVVAGGSAASSGETGEFAREAGAAGAFIGAQMATAARDSPQRFAGQIFGGLAGSSTVLRSAQRLGGPRTSRAASVAIQPGEEAAIFAARRGVPGTTRLANLVGDVDVNGRSRSFVSDESGQLDLTFRSETDAESESDGLSLTERLSDELNRMERGQRTRDAEARAEENVRESQEQLRQEEQTTDVEFEPSSPGGRTVSRRDTRTVNRQNQGINTGPSEVQKQAWNPTRRRASRIDRDPKPDEDLRVADEARSKPGRDLRVRAERQEATEARPQAGALNDGTIAGLFRGTEANIGQGGFLGARLEPDAAQRPFTGTEPTTGIDALLNTETAGRLDTRLEVDALGRLRAETRSEARSETRTDTRSESRQESRQENRFESRFEARSETRSETRAEGRQEPRREGDGRQETSDEDEGDVLGGLFGGEAEGVFTDFLNPLTGERIETERFE